MVWNWNKLNFEFIPEQKLKINNITAGQITWGAEGHLLEFHFSEDLSSKSRYAYVKSINACFKELLPSQNEGLVRIIIQNLDRESGPQFIGTWVSILIFFQNDRYMKEIQTNLRKSLKFIYFRPLKKKKAKRS